MPSIRRLALSALVSAAAVAALVPASASAIVGGRDARPGELPAVASITLGFAFGCTGTLVAPTWVLTAGHCGSLTGGLGVSSPIAWPAPLIDVRLNSITAHNGDGDALAVKRAVIPQQYLGFEKGYDVTLLELESPAAVAPIKIAGPAQTALWAPGVLQTIAGFGYTKEGGPGPDVLQVAQVPRITDGLCAQQQPSFVAQTMVCASYPQGGVDTCQGDSGGPLLGKTSTGEYRLTGSTSFGDGCARPGSPGVYARLGDATLRSFIAGYAPQAIDTTSAAAPVAPAATTTTTKTSAVARKTTRSSKSCRARAARQRTKRARAAARRRCAAAARKRA
jgi:secreted trypsin-like serine protease